MILVLLAVPPIVSVATHIALDRVRYEGLDAWWAAGRIVLPLLLLPFPSRNVQRSGLAALNIVQLVGLLGGLFR